jgi:hypothetical protein
MARDDIPLPGEVETDNAWFFQSRITIDPCESVGLQHADFPTVVIQPNPGNLEFLLHPHDRKRLHPETSLLLIRVSHLT